MKYFFFALFGFLNFFQTAPISSCDCDGVTIVNPSFETGIYGWNIDSGNLLAGSGMQVCGPSHGILDARNKPTTIWQRIEGSFEATELELSFFASGRDPENNDYYLALVFEDSLRQEISGLTIDIDQPAQNGEPLVQYFRKVDIPDACKSIKIEAHASGQVFYLDGLCLQPLRQEICELLPKVVDISCFDNNTPFNPNDDEFAVGIYVSGQGGSWTAADGIEIPYGQEFVYTLGPYSMGIGQVELHIKDAENQDCQVLVQVQAPPSCAQDIKDCFFINPLEIDCKNLPSSFDPMDIELLGRWFGNPDTYSHCDVELEEITPVVDFNTIRGTGSIQRRFLAKDLWDQLIGDTLSQMVTITCDNIPVGEISGQISTKGKKPIEGVYITHALDEKNLAVTDQRGIFEISDFRQLPDSIIITLVLERDHLNGVTTLDLFKLQQFLSGKTRFNSPYTYLAADINNSGHVTTLDFLTLRQMILGYLDTFPNQNSWRFIHNDHYFLDPDNPWLTPLKESVLIELGSQTSWKTNFTGVKIGDLNNSASTGPTLSLETRAKKDTFFLHIPDVSFYEGQAGKIEVFFPENGKQLAGLQFSLKLDSEAARIEAIEPGILSLTEIGLNQSQNGYLQASWVSESAKIDFKKPLFTILVNAVQGVSSLNSILSINNRYLEPEGYDASGTIFPVMLKFEKPTYLMDAKPYLEQNYPNPFAGKTSIGFNLPQNGKAAIKIFDASGKLVDNYSGHFEHGNHLWEIEAHHLMPGIYFYKLETDWGIITKKMIVID